MLRIEVLTLFPEVFKSFMEASLIKKGIERKQLSINLVNFRKNGIGRHLKVDDEPYGGGPGMLLRVEPIVLTLSEIKEKNFAAGRKTRTILITPQGETFKQKEQRESYIRVELLGERKSRGDGYVREIRWD